MAKDVPEHYKDEDCPAAASTPAQLLGAVTGRQPAQNFAHAAPLCTDRTEETTPGAVSLRHGKSSYPHAVLPISTGFNA